MTCPKCGADIPDGFTFCGKCGYNMADSTEEDKPTKPSMQPKLKVKPQAEEKMQPKPKIKSQQPQQNTSGSQTNKQQRQSSINSVAISCPNCGSISIAIERTGRYNCNDCGALFYKEKQQGPDWETILVDHRKMDSMRDFGWELVNIPYKEKATMRRDRNMPSYNELRNLQNEFDNTWARRAHYAQKSHSEKVRVLSIIISIISWIVFIVSVNIIFGIVAGLSTVNAIVGLVKNYKTGKIINDCLKKGGELRRQARLLL